MAFNYVNSVIRVDGLTERTVGDREMNVGQTAVSRESSILARETKQEPGFDLFGEARLIYSRARLAQRTRRSSGII